MEDVCAKLWGNLSNAQKKILYQTKNSVVLGTVDQSGVIFDISIQYVGKADEATTES
jgi:hypothetical protein